MFYLQFCILCMFDIMYVYDNKAIWIWKFEFENYKLFF